MTDKYKLTKKLWNESNSEIIQRSKAKYDRKNPIWSFRITPELLEWLNQERWNDGDGNPETNSALVIRKLNKLMKLENEGY
ncbi:MAG: hypothetical protein IM473_15515 [Microcystis sp. M015S2]|jgi:hypothetical protein|uniref:Uncharacterized protein n=1 Tax=Microcystis aeruginosa Ma_OC_H_19870700_S124 TaxID=2486262 RepID=A0A552A9T3_MICAE|nr:MULTISPECIES: hypothetical protein [unclassified Microcystis]TRT82204.1 MAG: hypothetical protein EWV63_20170 [Microcystis aeruginosa Ma_OC_H_19870700_S124]MBE9071300.1 hypothetical protein [Microcystis sp. LEGE 08355]MCA2710211.1 hypothetical protein [Microcystis sp. M025S2]MCA2743763.1 hypothetical protein [Microcystis sp. M015S2]MCA2760836.1 hypothetical protein [Microcystis sp. M145S2]